MLITTLFRRLKNLCLQVTHCEKCGYTVELQNATATEDGICEDLWCDHCTDFTDIWITPQDRLKGL